MRAASSRIVTGPDTGAKPQITTYAASGVLTDSFFTDTSGFTGGICVGMANVSGVSDIITGVGPGAGPHVRVFTGPSHTLLHSFFAFNLNFNLGIFIAGGDVNGDGRADIIVGTGDGTGSSPQVKTFSGANLSLLANFFAFGTNFNGGVRVAAGDVNGDGRADIIAGTGPGAAQIRVFSGTDQSLLRNFIPFAGFSGGVFVAAGDVNGDGFDDIIAGVGTDSSLISVFSGKDLSLLHNFFAFAGSKGGVRVAATYLNGDGRADILAGSGPGDPSALKAFDGSTLNVLAFFAPYGTSTKGVFPGAIPRFPAQLLNISTRLNVLTGDNALIGGFILTGTEPKKVIIRGMGPSSGVPGALADPMLELVHNNTTLANNNNWKTNQKREIEATGIPPGK